MTNNNLGFLIGLGFGLGVAILFAPRSGESTRSLIAKKTREGGDYLKQQAETARQAAADLVDQSVLEVKRQRDGLKQALDAGKQAYQNSMGA